MGYINHILSTGKNSSYGWFLIFQGSTRGAGNRAGIIAACDCGRIIRKDKTQDTARISAANIICRDLTLVCTGYYFKAARASSTIASTDNAACVSTYYSSHIQALADTNSPAAQSKSRDPSYTLSSIGINDSVVSAFCDRPFKFASYATNIAAYSVSYCNRYCVATVNQTRTAVSAANNPPDAVSHIQFYDTGKIEILNCRAFCPAKKTKVFITY